ncbi:hypothetical protein [Actinoallomurus sp. NPDC050550]|uniref:hypothetical protein n=1 Tax=Actinoallomurus sp. NPDC050550 TaxID=3154937 RepID=UPI00341142C7
MSLVHKTIAATIVSGVALMGAAGTAEAATAKPTKPVTKRYHVSNAAKKATARVDGTVTFAAKTTVVTAKGLNKSKATVLLTIKVYKGKKAVATRLVPVRPGRFALNPLNPKGGLFKTAATEVTLKLGKGKLVHVTPKRVF